MVSVSGEFYVDRSSVMVWSEIVSARGVKECVFVVEVGWKRTLQFPWCQLDDVTVVFESWGVGMPFVDWIKQRMR